MIGDRYLTDVVYGNRNGLFTVRPAPLTLEGEPSAVLFVSHACTLQCRKLLGVYLQSVLHALRRAQMIVWVMPKMAIICCFVAHAHEPSLYHLSMLALGAPSRRPLHTQVGQAWHTGQSTLSADSHAPVYTAQH